MLVGFPYRILHCLHDGRVGDGQIFERPLGRHRIPPKSKVAVDSRVSEKKKMDGQCRALLFTFFSLSPFVQCIPCLGKVGPEGPEELLYEEVLGTAQMSE